MHLGHQLTALLRHRFSPQFRADPHGDRFFALRTVRRDGSTRSTPIWLAPSDGRWYAYTPGRSWKVKRIRRDNRVWVAAATFRGEPLGPWRSGRAQVLPPSQLHLAKRALTAKYGNQFRLFQLLTVVSAFRTHGGLAVGLDITLDDEPLPSSARADTCARPGRLA